MRIMKETEKKNNCKDLKLKLDEGEFVWMGMDVHKKTWNVALYSANQERIVKSWHMPANLTDLLKTLEPIRKHIKKIGYEAGPTGFGLARFLQHHKFEVVVVSPADIPQTRRKTAKSDRIDAKALALELVGNRLRPIYIPTLEEEDARDAFRNRDQLRSKLRRVKTQIKSHLLRWGCAEPKGLEYWSLKSIAELRRIEMPFNAKFQLSTFLAELDSLEALEKKATEQMKSVVEERHAQERDYAQSVPGVGPVTSSAFLLEIPQLKRINNRRELAQLIGLAPLKRQSAEREKQCGRGHGGKKKVRSLLIEASWRWIGKDPGARKIFDRISAGKQNRRKKAIVALARRLAIILWHLVKEGRFYKNFDAYQLQTARQEG
jgi:transposase